MVHHVLKAPRGYNTQVVSLISPAVEATRLAAFPTAQSPAASTRTCRPSSAVTTRCPTKYSLFAITRPSTTRSPPDARTKYRHDLHRQPILHPQMCEKADEFGRHHTRHPRRNPCPPRRHRAVDSRAIENASAPTNKGLRSSNGHAADATASSSPSTTGRGCLSSAAGKAAPSDTTWKNCRSGLTRTAAVPSRSVIGAISRVKPDAPSRLRPRQRVFSPSPSTSMVRACQRRHANRKIRPHGLSSRLTSSRRP